MKKIFAIVLVLVISICGVVGLNAMTSASTETAPADITEEAAAYAAALASLEKHQGATETEMMVLAQEFLNKRDELSLACDQYMAQYAAQLAVIDNIYQKRCLDDDMDPDLVYEKELSPAQRKLLAEVNGKFEEFDRAYNELEGQYDIDSLPLLYYSIGELKGGLEESLVTLQTLKETLLGDDGEPETPGYSRADFDRLYDLRIAAEREVLDRLQSDPAPDLYTYSTMLYAARKSNPVVY